MHECLKLVQKIINSKSSNFLILNLRELYFPFLSINANNKLKIETEELFYKNNLTGLNIWSNQEDKEHLIINLNHIPKFSRLIGLKNLYKQNKISFSEVKNLEINNCNLLLDEDFENSTFESSNLFLIDNFSNYFENCNFRINCFFKSKENSINNNLTLSHCNFYNVINFNKSKIYNLSFINCNFYNKELDLSKITIINDNKDEVRQMIQNFREIEKDLGSKFTWPNFENDFGLLSKR